MPNTDDITQTVKNGAAVVKADVHHLSNSVGVKKLLGRDGMVPLPGAQERFELRSACDTDLRPNWVQFLVRRHRCVPSRLFSFAELAGSTARSDDAPVRRVFTTAQRVLNQVVAGSLTPILRPLGFKKTGHYFRRPLAQCTQVVNVQASNWSTAKELQFTVNMGVFYPEVLALGPFDGWKPSPSGPPEHKCQLRARLGQFMPGGEDKWWTIHAVDDAGPVANELRDVFKAHGLPWLEAVSSFEDARLRGDTLVAGAQLASLLTSSPAHTARLRVWALQHGLL